MSIRKIIILTGILPVLLVAAAGGADVGKFPVPVNSGGLVLMIRHAYAPGTGDPGNFRIEDCATQRNLDEQGRAQAREIGRRLRLHGVDSARVFSSQWCRCLETATLIDLGPVTELPALNSFFERPLDAGPNLAALREFLSQQPVDGEPILLITHFVTISAIAEISVSSGEGVLMRLGGPDGFKVLGRLSFDM